MSALCTLYASAIAAAGRDDGSKAMSPDRHDASTIGG
jgi:hypothetical protein